VSDGRVEVQVGEDSERARRGHELDAGTLACHRGGGSKKARIMTSRVLRSAHAVPRASRERVCGARHAACPLTTSAGGRRRLLNRYDSSFHVSFNAIDPTLNPDPLACSLAQWHARGGENMYRFDAAPLPVAALSSTKVDFHASASTYVLSIVIWPVMHALTGFRSLESPVFAAVCVTCVLQGYRGDARFPLTR
jgi:hypothetical protein